MLGSTYETITLPDDLAARAEGKSSLGRLGLLTHATAGFGVHPTTANSSAWFPISAIRPWCITNNPICIFNGG